MACFLFSGEETFLLQSELKRRKTGFLKKFGPDTISEYNSERRDPGQLQQDLFANDLFHSQKFVILHGIPTDSTPSNKRPASQIDFFLNTIVPSFDHINESNTVVFVAYKPDKRTKLYKFLDKNCDHKKFTPLKGPELVAYVIEATQNRCDAKGAKHLILKTGNTIQRIRNECDKLNTYCDAHSISKITDELIDQVVFTSTESDQFALLDQLFSNPKKALQLVETAQHNNDNRNMLMGTLLRGCKNMIQYLDYTEADPTQRSAAVGKHLGVHPFVISKYKQDRAKLSSNKPRLHNFFRSLLDVDYRIKTGQTPDTSFWIELKKCILEG